MMTALQVVSEDGEFQDELNGAGPVALGRAVLACTRWSEEWVVGGGIPLPTPQKGRVCLYHLARESVNTSNILGRNPQ